MVIFKAFKRLIYQVDMFCSSQLLRYNSETQYKTLTGGLLSLSIICVIVVGFASMIADTLKRVSISSTLVTMKQSNPPLANLIPGSENMFMLGLSVQSYDLSFNADLTHGPQYFSFQMNIINLNYGIPNVTSIRLQQCTRQHWNMMPEFEAGFDSFAVGSWLCLPLNTPLPLQGSYTSPVSYEMLIEIYPCQNQTSNNTCASQEEIEALFALHQNFYLSLNYINPVINPNQQNYISYYIQGNDYVIFSSRIGSQAWIYFSDYTINTDDSIWPYTHNTAQTGCIVQQKAINHPYSVSNGNPLASVFLAKSVNSLTYTRQVQKISAVFSYIGGLVGAITAVLFLIKSYTDISLEVSIGIKLFQVTKENEEQDNGKFNFVSFMRLALYKLLKLCGWSGVSERSQRLQRFQRQAVKQMDVELLLRRLIKLQTCMSFLFSPQRLQQIRQGQPITLDSAKKMRLLLLKEEETSQEKTIKMNAFDLQKAQIISNEIDLRNSQFIASRSEQSATSMRKNLRLKDTHSKNMAKDQERPEMEQQSPFTFSSIINKMVISKMENHPNYNNKVCPQNPRILPPLQHRHCQVKNCIDIENE